MQPQIEEIQKKLVHLSQERLAEVGDFIDFLQHRDQKGSLRQSYAQASEKAFSKVWNNDDDALYDDL